MNPTLSIPEGYARSRWVIGVLMWVAGISIAAAQQSNIIRVNVGGGAYTDSLGNVWSADTGFSHGSFGSIESNRSIAGTNDPELYRSQRWNPSWISDVLTYSFNVPNGTYLIRVHLAETFEAVFYPGGRVFDVRVEGALAIDNLDVFTSVGANTAYVRTVTARVSDGQLNIEFPREVENPTIAAIEIRSVPSLGKTLYRVTEIGNLDSSFGGVDLNDSGWVVARTMITSNYFETVLFRATGSSERIVGRPNSTPMGPGGGTRPLALNSRGEVLVGTTYSVNRACCSLEIWRNGTGTSLGVSAGEVAGALNDSGQIAGAGWIYEYGYLWRFAFGPGFNLARSRIYGNSWSSSINQRGWVAGSIARFLSPAEPFPYRPDSGPSRAFRWDGTALLELGTLGGAESRGEAIDDVGRVSGVSQDQLGRWRVALWDGSSTRDLGGLGGTSLRVDDMNESGWIAGDGTNAAGQTRAFVWDGSVLRELGTLGGPTSRVTDIDEAGWVAGSSTDAAGTSRAFLWTDGSGLLNLNTLIRSSDPLRPFVTLTEAVKINARGQILVNGTDSRVNQQRAYILNPADGTAPEITPTVSGTQGGGGWYRGNVTVSWTVSDPDSPITSTSGCGSTTVTFDTSGATYTCTATSEGGTTSRSVTVRRDSTPPSASAAPLTSPNGAGWYAGAVAVRFTGSDSLSGIASCSSDVTVSLEGSSVSSPGGTCTDVAGNVSAAVSATGLRIDRTAPSVSALRFPFANASGWINEAVTVSFTGSDALSGIAGCSGPVVLSLDGANQSAGGSCTDRAGNMGSTLLTGISIDRTAPTATTVLASAPNAAGWYREAVTVSFAGTDSMSGSGLAGCSAPVTVSTEGRNQTATGTCLDRAGNTSLGAVATVNVDRTSPTINVVSPQDGTSVRQGERLVAEYGCADGLSGVFACGGTVPSGTVLATDTAGTYTLTINATDAAGNTSARTVRFTVLAAEEPGGAPGRLELDPLGSNYAREPLGTVAPSGLDAASFTAEAWVQVGLPQLQETDASGVNRGTMALMSDGAYDLRVLYDASSGTPLKVIGRVWYLDGSGTLTPRVLESTAEAERIVLNAWTHVSVGYEASSNTCFKSVNGQVTVYAQCLPAGRTPAREYDQLFGIGTTDAGSGTGMCAAQLGSDPQRRNALNGSVDEVRISRVARYRAGFTPQGRLPLDADTLGLWRFDGAAGTTTFVNSVAGAVPLSGVASGARLAALQPGGIGGG